MISYNPKVWFSLIFKFHKSDTFRRLFWVMLSVGIYSAIVIFLELEVLHITGHGMAVMYQLLGFVISLLLVFRTNTAYERWWEGRKLWGSLVNNCRNLALKLNHAIKNEATREELISLVSAYPRHLREHLRGNSLAEIAPAAGHQLNFIANRIYALLQQEYDQGRLSGEQLLLLDSHCQELTNITGACERIRKTPIPYSYSLFIKKFMFVYIMTMPIVYARDYHYSVVPVVMFVFYVLASLELIAEEIEDPFGVDANDLPTDDLSRVIEENISDIKGWK